MKLYYVGPNLDATMPREMVKARTFAAVEPIADLILSYLRRDGFAALVGVSALNTGVVEFYPLPQPRPSYPDLGPRQERFGRWVATRFDSEAEVRAALIRMGDCHTPPPKDDDHGARDFFRIGSMISCRSVFYGYDGQAFLCLHACDDPPVSPDPELVRVEERRDILVETDYADGVEEIEDW
jgi:hypothetical protein